MYLMKRGCVSDEGSHVSDDEVRVSDEGSHVSDEEVRVSDAPKCT